jgi:integrase
VFKLGKDLNGKELGKGITQKKNGIYEARFNNRFGKRISVTGRNLKDVKRRYNECIYDDQKELNIREYIKLDDWFTKWMNVYKYDVVRENTKRIYSEVYRKHISPNLGNIAIQNITQLQIKELINKLKKEGYQYETQNKVKVMLSDMFNRAMNDEFVKRNPAKGVAVYKSKDKEVQVLSVEDQSDFFNCCKGTFYDNFFNVALHTGMRVGELAALRMKDVDFDNNVIHVTRTLVYQKYENDDKKTFHFENPKTETSKRDIPINKICELALKKQFLQKRNIANKAPASKKVEDEFSDLLFTTKFNTPINAQIMCDAIKSIVNEINIMRDPIDEMRTFSCHCFRHTFATRCFEAGIKAKTVQSYLGHASLKMTMDLYTSVLSEHMSIEMNKLENELEKINDEKYEAELIESRYNASKKVVNLGDYMELK